MTDPLTQDQARRIWAILVQYAGAHERDGDAFIHLETTRHITEYRFMGKLGFGGKFWRNSGRWYVSCYAEDDTPERVAAIEVTNGKLESLRKGEACLCECHQPHDSGTACERCDI